MTRCAECRFLRRAVPGLKSPRFVGCQHRASEDKSGGSSGEGRRDGVPAGMLELAVQHHVFPSVRRESAGRRRERRCVAST
eukprot:scaffold295_cov257-Pinguiococcus_pyrenoidosus.AAC.17